jgi:hypothetical protein
MSRDNHFMTTNQLLFQRNNQNTQGMQTSKSVDRGITSTSLTPAVRSKSPMIFSSRKNHFEEMAAGVKRMNNTLYSQPRVNGNKNEKFHHPSFSSNIVFYDTNMNMRAKNQFESTNDAAHSVTPNSKTLVSPIQRVFMMDGKVAERFTRKNGSNFRNKSSFDL